MKPIDLALQSALVAQQTIAEWSRDESGRVTVHPDVIKKAVDATVINLRRAASSEGERGTK